MSKFQTILILSSFVVLALADNFWDWPLEKYEAPTCISNNGTGFCLSCGIVAICLESGGTYTEIHGTCPSTSPCSVDACASPAPTNCTCKLSTGISYQCDPYNSQYYLLCIQGEVNFLQCPDGQEFDCESDVCITPTTTTIASTTTTPPPPPCTEVGIFPSGCTDFVVCTAVGQPPTVYSCPEGEFFDPNINNCALNEPFFCNQTTAGSGDHRDPYDCQRYYVCSVDLLVFTDCCGDGFYYDDTAGVSSCQPNNGECVDAIECAPSAAKFPSNSYSEFNKLNNFDRKTFFSK